jgi:NAD(P)-dependent dehydrogenase (short-subunit alcohol dehydrogenase family)
MALDQHSKQKRGNSMNKQILKGEGIIVGGGAKNLGGLVSRTFAAEGAKVCVHFNSAATKSDADKTVADIVAAGGEAFAIQGDFTEAAEVTAAFVAAKKRFGGIDIAVNTVGKVLRKPIVETTEAEFDNMMAINAKAAYFFIKEAGLPSMTAAKLSPSSRRCSRRSPTATRLTRAAKRRWKISRARRRRNLPGAASR